MELNLQSFFSLNDYSIRKTQDDDINALISIINDAYSYQDKAKGEPRTNLEHLRKRISETDFYTILYANTVIGCVYLEPKNAMLHLGLLTVAPKYRGQGIARHVLMAIEAYAKNYQYISLELDYMSLAPWLKIYYERYGFLETGEIQSWGAIELVHMRKILN